MCSKSGSSRIWPQRVMNTEKSNVYEGPRQKAWRTQRNESSIIVWLFFDVIRVLIVHVIQIVSTIVLWINDNLKAVGVLIMVIVLTLVCSPLWNDRHQSLSTIVTSWLWQCMIARFFNYIFHDIIITRMTPTLWQH